MKKLISSVITAMLAVTVAAGPAGAAIVITGDESYDGSNGGSSPDGSGSPGGTESPDRPASPDSPNENGLLGESDLGMKPLFDYLRPGTRDGAAVEHEGPRGTSETGITGVQLRVGDDLDLRVIDTNLFSTFDARRWNVPRNMSRADFAAVSAYVRGVVENEQAGAIEYPDWSSTSYRGTQTEELPEQTIVVPQEDAGGVIEWGAVGETVEFALNLLGDDALPSPLSDALPTGDQDIVINYGQLVETLLEPGELEATMDLDDAAATAASQVELAKMLQGLTEVVNAGIGHHAATPGGTTSRPEATSEAKEMKIEHMDVVDLSSLLTMLDLPPELLPDPVLAAIADAMGLDVESEWKELIRGDGAEELVDRVTRAQKGIEQALTSAVACGAVDDLVADAYGVEPFALADEMDLDVPSCTLDPLGALDRLADELDRVVAELRSDLEAAIDDAALISLEDLSVTAAASAFIDEKGAWDLGAGVAGGIADVNVAGFGSPVSVTHTADELNERQATANDRLNAVLGVLGSEYQDMVQMRFLPRLVEQGRVDGAADYVRAHAGVGLLEVKIQPPRVDPAQVLADLIAAAEIEDVDLLAGETDLGDLLAVASVHDAGPTASPGQAAGVDPIVITVGQMDAISEFTRPGVDLPDECSVDDPVCGDGTSTNLTRPWDPNQGDWGGPNSSTSLPRTGAASGTLPIAVAALLGVLSLATSRLSLGSPAGPWDRRRRHRPLTPSRPERP